VGELGFTGEFHFHDLRHFDVGSVRDSSIERFAVDFHLYNQFVHSGGAGKVGIEARTDKVIYALFVTVEEKRFVA
jgi:hypothetical protein